MKSEKHQTEPFRQLFWQNWCDILFIHWEVDPDAIAEVLPPELEPDLYQGKAWVGLVPFRMTGIRPVGLPAVPYLSHTLETNLRTYVKHKDPAKNTESRAVWFFSLEAANPFAVVTARLGYGLKYHRAKMWLNEHHRPDGSTIYAAGSVRQWPGPAPVTSFVQAKIPAGPYDKAQVNTLEHFLVERYALFTQHRGRVKKALVRHEPYRIKPAILTGCDPQLIAAAGLPLPDQVIENAIVHRAMDVRVRVG